MEFNRQSLDVITLGHLQEVAEYIEEHGDYIFKNEFLDIVSKYGLEAYLDEIYLGIYIQNIDINAASFVNFLDDENISLEDVLRRTYENAMRTTAQGGVQVSCEGSSLSKYGLITIFVENKQKYLCM